MTPTHGSLFTGINGFGIGFDQAGFEPRWHSEVDRFCNRVLDARYEGVPNLGDVERVSKPPRVDVLTFGSPCQDLSVAGRRAGLAGARSGLFFEAARIINECHPTFAIWENVPGAFSSNRGRDFAAVLYTLRELGANDVAWRVFDSQYAGVPQQRRRIYLVADFRGRRAGEILFESESCEGHPAPGPQTWESLAGTVAGGAYGTGRRSIDAPNLVQALPLLAYHPRRAPDENFAISPAMTSKWAKGTGGSAGDETQNLTLSHALTSEGADASEDGTGRGTPLALIQDVRSGAHKRQNGAGVRQGEIAYTLDQVSQPAVMVQNSRSEVRSMTMPGTIAADPGAQQQHYVFHPDAAHRDGVARQDSPDAEGRLRKRDAGSGIRSDDQTFTLNAGEPPSVGYGARIRRFTPVECERLQGFPDGWTCLCGAGADIFACVCPDGPRYRALGNACTTTVPGWLALRILKYFD